MATKVSFTLGETGVTARIEGFSPVTMTVADLPEKDRNWAMVHGLEKVIRNSVAGKQDAPADTVYGILLRKVESLKAGARDGRTAAGINWTVFPAALQLVLNERPGAEPVTIEQVNNRLVGMPQQQQIEYWNMPAVQAKALTMLAERAAAAIPTTVDLSKW